MTHFGALYHWWKDKNTLEATIRRICQGIATDIDYFYVIWAGKLLVSQKLQKQKCLRRFSLCRIQRHGAVFEHLLKRRFPRLHAHLVSLDVMKSVLSCAYSVQASVTDLWFVIFSGKLGSTTFIIHDALVFVFVHVSTMLGYSTRHMGLASLGRYGWTYCSILWHENYTI